MSSLTVAIIPANLSTEQKQAGSKHGFTEARKVGTRIVSDTNFRRQFLSTLKRARSAA
jgi:hypothetical protein